jgi:hypothetical protein
MANPLEATPYRVYLVEENVCICVGQYHFASDDPEAKKIETALNEACADTFGYFEVWRGTDCIAMVQKDLPRPVRMVEDGVRPIANLPARALRASPNQPLRALGGGLSAHLENARVTRT